MKIYKTLGKTESILVGRLSEERHYLFSQKEVRQILGCGKAAGYATTYSLTKKGWIRAVEKGKYLLCNISGTPFLEPLQIASRLVWPSYVSFWSALNFYHYTEQVPQTIFVATTRQKRGMVVSGRKIQFVKMAKKRFFGYAKTGDIVMAEREKAIADSLLFPRYAGGITEIAKAMREARGEISAEKLAGYAVAMGSKPLAVRLGYLLESTGYSIPKKAEGLLLNSKSTSFPKLDPAGPRKGRADKKWGVLINTREEELK